MFKVKFEKNKTGDNGSITIFYKDKVVTSGMGNNKLAQKIEKVLNILYEENLNSYEFFMVKAAIDYMCCTEHPTNQKG